MNERVPSERLPIAPRSVPQQESRSGRHDIDVTDTTSDHVGGHVEPQPKPEHVVDRLVPVTSTDTTIRSPSSSTATPKDLAVRESRPQDAGANAADPMVQFLGIWRGVVKQKWARRYSVVVAMDGESRNQIVGSIEYPELDCGGSLRLVESSLTRVRLAEMLTYGHGRCVSGGQITIERPIGRNAAWNWADGDPRHLASAVLTRD